MQVQRAAVTEMLRPAEEALIEQRALLECICMPPILQSHAEGVDAVLSVLTGSAQRLSRGLLLAFAASCLLHCASHFICWHVHIAASSGSRTVKCILRSAEMRELHEVCLSSQYGRLWTETGLALNHLLTQCACLAAPGQPHPAALQQVPEHMLMEMACQPARRKEALLAATHIRECDPGTTWMVSTALRGSQRAEVLCSPQRLRLQLSCRLCAGFGVGVQAL